MPAFESFSKQYHQLLSDILQYGVEQRNARTKHLVRVLPGTQFLNFDLSTDQLPVPANRRYFPHIAAAEVAWQFMGTRNASFILEYAPKLWSKFAVQDGEGGKMLETAYGWRWKEAFGRDQLKQALEVLRQDPSSRQVFISTWDARSDGLGEPNQPLNIPCPVGFTLNVVGDSLHMSVLVRSSDVFLGLPYDVMGYALTLDAIAAELDLMPGSMGFTLAHAHLYENQVIYAIACTRGQSELLWQERKKVGGGKPIEIDTTWADAPQILPTLPGWSVSQIQEAPDRYVAVVTALARRSARSEWSPVLEVVQ